ncbi:MAG: peptidylprolyl isomerase [Devosia nanyangense]|nr:peptidylprolyl isomerase [Devosia nanyangense]QMV04131.1 peptidylprolyl isomerase [Devosia sp. D6-9]
MIATFAFAVVAAVAGILVAPQVAQAQQSGTPHLMLQLKDGVVDIELLPAVAPKHVERIVTLTNQGFYNGIVFHRVIEGFMAQTGDPTGTGMGGSDLPDLQAEFSSEPFVRGTVGAARTQDPNSANSQFFIMFGEAPHLNGQYTVFGKVVAGMELVDNIKKGAQSDNGTVTDPDKIISAKIEYK